MLYQSGNELSQQPATEVVGQKVMEMYSDGLTTANDAQRLTVPPSYVSLKQPMPDNCGNPPRCGRAGGCTRRQSTTTTDNVIRSGVGTSCTGNEDLNSEAQFEMGSTQFASNSAQFGMGSSQLVYTSAQFDNARLPYMDSQIVLYDTPMPQQFHMNNFNDGFDDDNGYASPSCPVENIHFNSTPIPMTFESASTVTTPRSLNDGLKEQAPIQGTFRGRGRARGQCHMGNNAAQPQAPRQINPPRSRHPPRCGT